MDPLAEMIRAKIKAGALPRTISFVNTWYGRGTGRQCIACEQRIAVLARRLFWAGHCPM